MTFLGVDRRCAIADGIKTWVRLNIHWSIPQNAQISDLAENRWLAAPVIPSRIGNGVLTFTPDASREEADQIVLGLNNVAKKVQDKSSW